MLLTSKFIMRAACLLVMLMTGGKAVAQSFISIPQTQSSVIRHIMQDETGMMWFAAGHDVYAFDAYCPAEVIEKAGVHAVANQDALFETCDVVSLHIPATPETKQSINYALVGKMKKGGILVNTARKEVINEPELIKLMGERED